MKNVQLNQTEVTLVLNALTSRTVKELNTERPDIELLGRLTAIKHKIETAGEIPTTV